MTMILIIIIIALYGSGILLMRAFLKVADTNDKDSVVQLLIWPYTINAAIGELLIEDWRNIKW